MNFVKSYHVVFGLINFDTSIRHKAATHVDQELG